MQENWETPKPLRSTVAAPAAVAAIYWLTVIVVFFALRHAGWDMIGDGAILVAWITAPWSALMIAAGSSPSFQAPMYDQLRRWLVSDAGTFVVFPVLCGGTNAVLIFALVSAVQRRQQRGK